MIRNILLNRLIYCYTTNSLAYIREKYNLRVCFKKKELQFLKRKDIISKGISNRIVVKGNFIKSYKQFKYFYIKLLRSNLLQGDAKSIKKNNYIFKTKDTSFFFNAYKQSLFSLNDLDRVLLWRATQINSLFRIIYTEKKQKKQFFYQSRIQFIKPEKRILLVWSWLSVFIRAFNIKDKKWEVSLLPSIENYLVAREDHHILSEVKLQIYKLQLLRTI